MPQWDSAQYLKFEKERTQPAIDLAGRIELESAKSVLDLDCGPGNSTAVLARRFPSAHILGVDSSQQMIEAARVRHPGMDFRLCDARQLDTLGEQFDVIFSNACIQWVPDHPTLLKSLMECLREGGVLAVQTPMNYEEPIHRIISETAASPNWAARFRRPRIFYNLTQGEYFDLLSTISSGFTLWQTTYFHVMESHEAILEWYRGTGLRPYLEVLNEEDRTEFEQEIVRKLVKEYPVQESGKIIFRFPRFFFLARK